jgi:hypothetical protein
MGRVAAITPFFDTMTTLTEGGSDFLRNAKIFTLNAHSIKRDRMAALLEFLQLFFVALPALFRKDHRLLFRGSLMVNMTGHAMDPILGMLGFHP